MLCDAFTDQATSSVFHLCELGPADAEPVAAAPEGAEDEDLNTIKVSGWFKKSTTSMFDATFWRRLVIMDNIYDTIKHLMSSMKQWGSYDGENHAEVSFDQLGKCVSELGNLLTDCATNFPEFTASTDWRDVVSFILEASAHMAFRMTNPHDRSYIRLFEMGKEPIVPNIH